MIVLTQMEYVFFTQKTQNHGKRKVTKNHPSHNSQNSA